MKEIVNVDRLCDCGNKLTDEEIKYYGNTCHQCEIAAMDNKDTRLSSDEEPGEGAYIPLKEYERLKRLDENVRKNIEALHNAIDCEMAVCEEVKQMQNLKTFLESLYE